MTATRSNFVRALTAGAILALATALPLAAGGGQTTDPASVGETVGRRVYHRTVQIDGLDISYREAGPADAPTILLLHGFPTSSHMFRNLIPALADEFHVVAPDYPEIARMSQLEGTVIVKVLVGPDGSVMEAAIVTGVHPLLNRSALAAARKAKFSPGKQRNIPVKAWMAIPYRFRLN